jgi:hypothetical protein
VIEFPAGLGLPRPRLPWRGRRAGPAVRWNRRKDEYAYYLTYLPRVAIRGLSRLIRIGLRWAHRNELPGHQGPLRTRPTPDAHLAVGPPLDHPRPPRGLRERDRPPRSQCSGIPASPRPAWPASTANSPAPGTTTPRRGPNESATQRTSQPDPTTGNATTTNRHEITNFRRRTRRQRSVV